MHSHTEDKTNKVIIHPIPLTYNKLGLVLPPPPNCMVSRYLVILAKSHQHTKDKNKEETKKYSTQNIQQLWPAYSTDKKNIARRKDQRDTLPSVCTLRCSCFFLLSFLLFWEWPNVSRGGVDIGVVLMSAFFRLEKKFNLAISIICFLL